MNKPYQVCNRCVMDTTDPDIFFNSYGICNYCEETLNKLKNYYNPENNDIELRRIIQKVKNEGKNKKYDCIIGLSGGIDSSYLAYTLVRKFGINALAVHVDNGWNSEKAVSNIYKIVKALNIDLFTHVIDWDDFRELQKSFLYASVVDLEMLSDHAIVVVINKLAVKHKIKYFCIGSNFQTESIMPSNWFYSEKFDSLNIKDIYKRHGSDRKITTFPFLNFYEYFFFAKNYGLYLMPLSYIDYDKKSAKSELIKELDWEDYGAKHHESFITKFYQTYILPQKFGIDKRRAHFSSLICANQISREDALNELKRPLINEDEIDASITYFCKKMELSREQFHEIMSLPQKKHTEYKSYRSRKENLWKLIRKIR